MAASLLAGCGSPSSGGDRFADVPGSSYTGKGEDSTNTTAAPASIENPDLIRTGDSITVTFADMPTPVEPIAQKVKDDGTITLLHNQNFQAAGKRRGDLEKEIRARYVPNYYKNLTVTIKSEDRFYFVGGEVRSPGRQLYLGPMTVIKAIQSCGDFTDFANKKRVKLTRMNGKTYSVNAIKAIDDPKYDLEVLPGDSIHVPRRPF